MAWLAVNKDGKTKYIIKDDVDKYLQNGYTKGAAKLTKSRVFRADAYKSYTTERRKAVKRDLHAVHLGNIVKYVHSNEIDDFLKAGWSLGGARR